MRDVDRALSLARLTGTQSAIVQIARELSWSEPAMRGESEAKPFELNATEIAKLLKTSRQQVSKAKSELVDSKILRRSDKDSLLINKDYTTWIHASGSDKGKEMFDLDQLAYITRPLKKTKDLHRIENDAPTASKTMHVRIENDAPPASKTMHFDLYEDIGTHASEDLRETERLGDGEEGIPQPPPRRVDSRQIQPHLPELVKWHEETYPKDLSFTHVQISLLLRKAPDRPEWVKDAIEQALGYASGNKYPYAKRCLEARVADPEAWERERAKREAKTSAGGKALPSQTAPPPNLYTPTPEALAQLRKERERRKELGRIEYEAKRKRLAK